MAPGVARAWKLVKGGGVTGSTSKSRDDHPGMPSRRWEGCGVGDTFRPRTCPSVRRSSLALEAGQLRTHWGGLVTIVCL